MDQTHSILVVQGDGYSPVVRTLSGAGYQVSKAKSVAEAIIKCYRQRFDLVISDIELNDGTGEDVARQAGQWATPSIVIEQDDLELLHRVKKVLTPSGQAPMIH